MTALPTWVHIGLPKTGTTTLQQVIFARHEQIFYLGKFADENLNSLSRELTVMPPDRLNDRQAFDHLGELRLPQSDVHRVCIFSEELLSYAKQVSLELGAVRTKQLFPDARILLVLRNPFEWLQSIYFFNLKRRQPDVLQGFNKWLAVELSKPPQTSELATISIDLLSENYSKQFGRDAIKVALYEEFRFDAEHFLHNLSTILGIDPGRTIELYKSSARKRLNLRLTTGQEEFCRKFELVTRGHYREYVEEITPLIEKLPPDKRDRAKQMLPTNYSAGAMANRRLRALSRFIDGAAYSVLSHGETAIAAFEPEIYRAVRNRIEEGYRRAASGFGVDVSAYFEDSLDFSRRFGAVASSREQPIRMQEQGNQPFASPRTMDADAVGLGFPVPAGDGEEIAPELFNLFWEKLHVAAHATGRNCNSHFVELVQSVCCQLPIGACFEIGAFEASFSKEMKSRRPELAVFAFEANNEVFRRFQRDMPAGVAYLNEAIGAQEGMCEFHIPVAVAGKDGTVIRPRRGNIRTSSLRAQRSTDVEYESISCKCSTLDAWMGELDWPGSALWIDVEGAAKEVLMGARKSLRNGVQCVAIEMEKRSFWADQWLASDITVFMAEFDFLPLARDMETGWQYNQIFLHRSAISQSVLKAVGNYIDVLLRQVQ